MGRKERWTGKFDVLSFIYSFTPFFMVGEALINIFPLNAKTYVTLEDRYYSININYIKIIVVCLEGIHLKINLFVHSVAPFPGMPAIQVNPKNH